MAALTSKTRNALPSSVFAGPGRSYPIPDREHAGLAKNYAKQELDKGNLSPADYKHIVARANAKLLASKLSG
jgi:hypothetical protein